MKLPLHIVSGVSQFMLCDAKGRYIAKSCGDSEEARQDLLALMVAMNHWESMGAHLRDAKDNKPTP